MSGIAGYWAFSSSDLPINAFAAFARGLAHRGPDGFGIECFPDARLWLGHCRLASRDCGQSARQPLAYANRRYWLTYDGNIYNAAALREELLGLGHGLVAQEPDDVEVTAAAYAQWGVNALSRFDGMWAFAVWEAEERRLFLSRDRFGIKPLYYAMRGGAFAFASELKAFLTLPWVRPDFDRERLADTIVDLDRQEASPKTLLPDVYRLPPGHAMVVDSDGRVHIEAWWNTLDHLPRPPLDLRKQAAQFRALLFDSCRLCLRSRPALAVEQSGGLDSSSIACTVAELERGNADGRWAGSRYAFVASFTDNKAHDERRDARIVCDRTKMPLHCEEIDGRQAADAIDRIIFDHEIVFRFPRVGPWMLYRAMRRRGFYASLNGLGVDDLLGSDSDYIGEALDAALARLDLSRYRELRQILRRLAGGNVTIDRARLTGETRALLRLALTRLRLKEFARALETRCRQLSTPSSKFSSPRAASEWLRDAGGKPVGFLDQATALQAASLSRLDAKRYLDFHISNRLYLSNFDRSSMAHGVELHMPFMDWRVVTYAFALPEESRNGAGQTKRVLRLAMEGLVPDSVRLRTSKTAFTVPLDDWARGALKPWLLDLCASREFLESASWNGPALRSFVDRAVAGQASLAPAWPIIHAYALQRAFRAQSVGTAADISSNNERIFCGVAQ